MKHNFQATKKREHFYRFWLWDDLLKYNSYKVARRFDYVNKKKIVCFKLIWQTNIFVRWNFYELFFFFGLFEKNCVFEGISLLSFTNDLAIIEMTSYAENSWCISMSLFAVWCIFRKYCRVRYLLNVECFL